MLTYPFILISNMRNLCIVRVRHRNCIFLYWLVRPSSWHRRVWVSLDLFVRVGSLLTAMSWQVEHHTFALQCGFSSTMSQWCRHNVTFAPILIFRRRQPVPDNIILRLVEYFNTTDSIMKKEPSGLSIQPLCQKISSELGHLRYSDLNSLFAYVLQI